MSNRDIIVVGASSGGMSVIRKLMRGLPSDFPAAIFIVWHISPFAAGILPDVLDREGALPAKNAVDREEIKPGHIYVAPPDRHLLVERGHMRVTRGPKENRFRPAVDPLFRSAAYAYGSRVIGIVLTGALDDGTSGLWTIKQKGGTAIVQAPTDAEYPSMPQSAMREVDVDYVASVSEMPDLLISLVNEPLVVEKEISMQEDKRTAFEVGVAAEDEAFIKGITQFGELSPFSCPDCHGVLFRLKDGKMSRFRCHTGHAYSADSLLASITESIEESVWSSIRAIDESILLLNHMSEHLKEDNPRLAAVCLRKAEEAHQRAQLMREVVLRHEQLSADSLLQQSGEIAD